MNYLLDTNLLLLYIRQGESLKKLEREMQLFSGKNKLLCSVVTIGEIKAIAMKNGWGQIKLQTMELVISKFMVLDIHTQEIVNRYAEIDAFSQGKHPNLKLSSSARNMGKNDIWIAATASVYNLILLSTDNDFSHLIDSFLELQIVSLT